MQYFNTAYYKHADNAVIADCGAYNGDSLRQFIQLFQDDFKGYHCFEMDRDAYLELERCRAKMAPELQNKIALYPFGVFSEKGTAYYNASTDTLGSSISINGKKEVQLAVLDEILENEEVTMIKMDIEDSELPALVGAGKLIQKNHPILYMGLHTTVTDDTVLYAVPIQ